MKRIGIIIFFALITNLLVAQNDTSFNANEPMKFQLSSGLMFAGGHGFSGNSLWMSPSLTKDLSKKFSLQVGTLFQSTTLFSAPDNEMFSTGSTFFNLSYYGSLLYRLNEDVIIHGGLLYSQAVLSKNNPSVFGSGLTFYGGVDFRVSKKSTIGISVAYSKDDYPFICRPSPYSVNDSWMNTQFFVPRF